jgi:hypothetical protein
MADNDYRSWQVPPAAATEDDRLGWVNEACEEGMAWCRVQRGYPDWKRSLNILSGREDMTDTATTYRSRVSTNRLKRNVREVTSTLSKLRPLWGYYSDNKAYSDNAELFNKVIRFWYLTQGVDRFVHQGLDYAAATGTGWLRPVYRRRLGGYPRKGDITILTYGAPCVLPVQLPASGDWQEAYAVTIMDEMPIYMAHGMFPQYQHRLRPTSSRYWYMNDGVRQAANTNFGGIATGLARAFGKIKRTPQDVGATSDLFIPIRYTYVNDLSINMAPSKDAKSAVEIPMGEFGSSWAYRVPYYGQKIPAGRDIISGSPIWREANEEDARLYPYRRLIISSETVIMYDGPAFDWHGMFPCVKFQLDPWPWEPLGFSATHDGYELQNAINEIARGNMDKTRSQLNMALVYDINATDQKQAENFDPMQPRARIGVDMMGVEGGMPFLPAVPPEVLKVEPESLALWDKFETTMDAQMAINDVVTLAKLRAVGTMDDIEKIMEANGPILEDMSRGMEPPMRELGTMIKYDIMQYYTTARVMNIVGPDGMTLDTFDYDPASLVPSHLAGEDPQKESYHTPAQRARTFADNLEFYIMPNTLHEIHQMTMKLGLIQLRKAGVMIDSQTIAEAWNVPNWGHLMGNTVLDRWKSEQQMQLEQAAALQAIGAEMGLAPPGAANPSAGKQNPEGRPPSGQAAPQLKSKEGGARSTITESK